MKRLFFRNIYSLSLASDQTKERLNLQRFVEKQIVGKKEKHSKILGTDSFCKRFYHVIADHHASWCSKVQHDQTYQHLEIINKSPNYYPEFKNPPWRTGEISSVVRVEKRNVGFKWKAQNFREYPVSTWCTPCTCWPRAAGTARSGCGRRRRRLPSRYWMRPAYLLF